MRRKTIILFTILFLAGSLAGMGAARFFAGNKPAKNTPEQSITITSVPTPQPVPIRQKSIFVPYWASVGEEDSFEEYDRIIYFGVAANTEGITDADPGAVKLSSMLPAINAQGRDIWVALRMTDTDTNIAVLNDLESWERIASESAALRDEWGFDGLVLDLEVSALPSEGLRSRISEFIEYLARSFSDEDIPFSVAIYGDVFYRKRPYDIERIGQAVDEIIVMAYDFHKAGGEPGPNFPAGGKSRYNYDFSTMLRDYLFFVPPEKLTIAFGMYGYDWIVDEQKRPIKPATSLTLHQVRARFLDTCEHDHCIVRRDEEAGESEVNYIDIAGNYHIVWFEDTVSMDQKMMMAQQNGIGSAAFWAWSYF